MSSIKTINFKDSDVKAVATKLLEFGVSMVCYGDTYPYQAYECECCGGEPTQLKKDFKHKLDCEILVANDLLTNIED